MTPEDRQTLLRVAEWTIHSRRKVMNTIRELAGTEENYLIIARELDRVNANLWRARSLHVEATLTLVDWIKTLIYFEWQCAFCQEKPFQAMHHYIPLPLGGMTPSNCIPVCYSCMKHQENTQNFQVRVYP